MYTKFACCSFTISDDNNDVIPNIMEFPEYNITDKDLIINNVFKYICDHIYIFNINIVKLLIFFTDNFEIVNITLIMNSYLWGYVSIPFTISENIGIIFDTHIWIFNIKKWTNGDINIDNLKKINYTDSQIIHASPKPDKFIAIEENGNIHVSCYTEENQNFYDQNYYSPLYIDSPINFIDELRNNNNYNNSNMGILIIYENNIISFISKTKKLFGIQKLFGMSYFKNIKSNKLWININLDNTLTINYRGLLDRKTHTFDYYLLESLMLCVVNKKITNMYILKYIMISLFNKENFLQLFNILIENFLHTYKFNN
jgi:hypothetical protein